MKKPKINKGKNERENRISSPARAEGSIGGSIGGQLGDPEWTDDPLPQVGSQSRLVCNYLNWAHTTRPVILLSCSAFLALRENSSSPQSLIRTPYIVLIVPGPCHSLHTFFHSLSTQAHTPSAPATLSTSESSSLSPTHLCSKPHLLSILRFQDDCIASYPHSTAPIHRRTSLSSTFRDILASLTLVTKRL